MPTTSTPGYRDDKAAIARRLRRIEGQVRGLQTMVETDRDRADVLDQIAAVTRALQAVALALLEDHLAHCVAGAATDGAEPGPELAAKVAEASSAIARLVRS